MMNRKGGSSPSLFLYRLFAGALLCGIVALGIVLVQKISPVAHAATPDLGCGVAPPKLEPLDISSKTGLIQQESQPLYYKVEAPSLAAAKTQINACSPVTEKAGVFVAETLYTINWRASYPEVGNGICKIDAVVVGLNSQHLYPRWNAPAAVAKTWAVFMDNLAVHESGHTALDQQYASALLSDLKAVRPQSCAAIKQQAEFIAKERLAALEKANSDYDAATGHGRTQGATLQ